MEGDEGNFEPAKVVVGMYGISGAGKSHCLALLRSERPEWRCIDGSQVMEQVLKDHGYSGLESLKSVTKDDVATVRQEAVQRIQGFAGVTVVAGHGSFPKRGDSTTDIGFDDVFTKADGETYNAILYLDVDAEAVYQQRRDDKSRVRDSCDVSYLERWMRHEKELLKNKCAEHGIVFELVRPDDVMECIVDRVVNPWVESVLQRSKVALEHAVSRVPAADVYLMIDGDRTFTPMDTGRAFFDSARAQNGRTCPAAKLGDPLRVIYSRYKEYCPQAFVEAAMLYTSVGSYEDYKSISHDVGHSQVQLYDSWLPFLSRLPARVHPILISCSNREVWSAALMREGLKSQSGSPGNRSDMSLIAGNHLGLHSYIVDIEAKGLVVSWLRQFHPGCTIISFGDSALDALMLESSDRAYVVLDGDRRNRSLQPFLTAAVRSRKRSVYQIDLSGTTHPRVFHDGIRVGSLDGLLQELTDGTIRAAVNVAGFSRAAAILAQQTRRADLSPPSLQAVHEQVGRLLADAVLDEFSFDGTLVEEEHFDHVQGSSFTAPVAKSSDVAILALMRGGDPMARGVFARLPSASFVHYWSDDQPLDFDTNRPCPLRRIYVVDSVINRGDSVRRVLRRLEEMSSSSAGSVRRWAVYVLSGVMHEATARTLPREFPRVRFVTLRISSNQYSGSGGTDTGNRLFGTYH